MRRDIRIYLLIVVLPAIFLVAGGIRLVALERGRAKDMAVEALNAKAAELARGIAAKIIESGCVCRDTRPPHYHKENHEDHEAREGREGREGREPHEKHGMERPPMRPGDMMCRLHELPPKALEIVTNILATVSDERSQCVAELRHACGCTVVSSVSESTPVGVEAKSSKVGRVITGSIFGMAEIKPSMPGYSVYVAPAGGDAAVALGMRAQGAFAAILLLLFAGTLSAGVTLLVRSARRANEEARAKTDFLSNVSHELKTPLTSIAMFSEMLERGTLEPAAAKKACGTIMRESRRLGRLIDGLLEYARLERGTRKYRIDDVDVGEVVEDAHTAFAPSFPNGLAATCEDGMLAKCDRDALRRIIDCLLENAAKYASSAPVSITGRKTDEGVVVTVADSGPGISPADAKHIFERFWRADNSVTRTTGGAGLGLAIAHELAAGMNATLSYRPNAPCGTTFEIIVKL